MTDDFGFGGKIIHLGEKISLGGGENIDRKGTDGKD